jgi:hypothetical protein
VFILCRSAQRTEKERAKHERFEKRIEAGLTKIVSAPVQKWVFRSFGGSSPYFCIKHILPKCFKL